MSAAIQKIDESKAYIVTYTGKQFWLLKPKIEDICIEDIAHSLSMQCRWTGHTKYHYSIAQHCYYCSLLGPENEALERLMHDASEAYMGDMNRPLKHYTEAGPAYRRQENVVQGVIGECFGLAPIEPRSVHDADQTMLYTEKSQLITMVGFGMSDPWGDVPVSDNIIIEEWTPAFAEKVFLKRFEELYKRRTN
jgi:hypothetical protein